MRRKFYSIANRLGVAIVEYKSYVAKGVGGLQVYEIRVKIKNRILLFADSYFHLSGDTQKVLQQFEYEIKQKLNP